ncbi:hypothetical protein D3C71_1983280 [compost metagenome]
MLQDLVGPFHFDVFLSPQADLLLQERGFQRKLLVGCRELLLLLLEQLLRFAQCFRLLLQLFIGHPELIRLG